MSSSWRIHPEKPFRQGATKLTVKPTVRSELAKNKNEIAA
jgi:hypothetical protein